MRRDPAVIAAAAALLVNWSPTTRGFLDLTTDEAMLLRHVVDVANERRFEELRALAEAIGVSVGNRVAEILAKAFG